MYWLIRTRNSCSERRKETSHGIVWYSTISIFCRKTRQTHIAARRWDFIVKPLNKAWMEPSVSSFANFEAHVWNEIVFPLCRGKKTVSVKKILMFSIRFWWPPELTSGAGGCPIQTTLEVSALYRQNSLNRFKSTASLTVNDASSWFLGQRLLKHVLGMGRWGRRHAAKT